MWFSERGVISERNQEAVMKKYFIMVSVFLCLVISAGCQRAMDSPDALLEKAREEIPIANADTIALQYAGMYALDDSALLWFISGNEYQKHYYLPMECVVPEEAEYTFVRTYKPMEFPVPDIAGLHWKDSYCFLINNPDCRRVKITDASGIREVTIAEDAYPYILSHQIVYSESVPTEYQFLDAFGNEL
jgi:hypothetical protein